MFFALGAPVKDLKALVKDFVAPLRVCFAWSFLLPLGALWGQFVCFLGPTGPILKPRWTMLALSGAMFGPFWSHVVSSWPFLVPFGTIFGPF